MSSTKVVNVYAELTPNPNSLKFVADVLLVEGGTLEYRSPEEAINCPLAQQLFSFSGVKAVFISSNFITITKESDIDWFDITTILREFIRGFLMSDEPLFIGHPFSKSHIPAEALAARELKQEENKKAAAVSPVMDTPADPEAEQKIIAILEEYVRPAVEGDGGAIHFHSYHNGVVRVEMKGACSGCPSSTVTLKAGIENILKQMVPGVKEVVAV